jgi:hypothetical protein
MQEWAELSEQYSMMDLSEFKQDTTLLESEKSNSQTEDQPTKDD